VNYEHGNKIMVKRREQRKPNEAAKDHVEDERQAGFVERATPGLAISLFAGLLSALGYFGVMLVNLYASSGDLAGQQIAAAKDRIEIKAEVRSHIESSDIRLRRVEVESARNKEDDRINHARIK